MKTKTLVYIGIAALILLILWQSGMIGQWFGMTSPERDPYDPNARFDRFGNRIR